MYNDAKIYSRVTLPVPVKAGPSPNWPPHHVDYPSPQVLQTIHNHIRSRHGLLQPQDSFFVADPDMIGRSIYWWRQLLPEIEPYYGKEFRGYTELALTLIAAVKCNNEKQLLLLLARMDIGFDCASSSEISQVLNIGVRPERVIFASPCKDYDQIQYARVCGIQRTVFDSESELRKLSHRYPEAELHLRILADNPQSGVRFTQKFGAPIEYAKYLLQRAEELRMKVTGICFHVGSSASDPLIYARAIANARIIYDEALQRGFLLRSINIGGGFTSSKFGNISHVLRYAMVQHFGSLVPKIHWMAEPGRLFVEDAFHLACRVFGTRQVHPNRPMDVYVNDSIYKNFLNALAEPPIPTPMLMTGRGNANGFSYELEHHEMPRQVLCTIWGQTCCGLDRIRTDCQFTRSVQIDDWILFPSMGAYSHVCASHFNGFRGQTQIIYAPIYSNRQLHIVN